MRSGGEIWRTDFSGWNTSRVGTPVTQVVAITANNDNLYLMRSGGEIWRTDFSGWNTSRVGTPVTQVVAITA
jgi:hypothetical protein